MEVVSILHHKLQQHHSFKSWICHQAIAYVSNPLCVRPKTGASANILGGSGHHFRSAEDLERDVEIWAPQELEQSRKVQKEKVIESSTSLSASSSHLQGDQTSVACDPEQLPAESCEHG